MASITIQHSHKNLLFAAMVADQTGAEFEERDDGWITISSSPILEIPHYCFTQIFDEGGQQDIDQLDTIWRSLILNKSGYLVHFSDSEIVISDQKPKDDKRPQFLLRFPDHESKAKAEMWAERASYPSLTDYILEAIQKLNQEWEKQAKG